MSRNVFDMGKNNSKFSNFHTYAQQTESALTKAATVAVATVAIIAVKASNDGNNPKNMCRK